MRLFLSIFIIFSTFNLIRAELPLNSSLPLISLSEDKGGRLNGSPWSLQETLNKKKVSVIFYVDPDVKDRNEEISQRLSKRNFSKEKVQYLAIINMNATWLPNFAIEAALKKKQQKYRNTLYLKDFDKVGIKAWKIPDHENNIIVLNKSGRVIYSHFGEVKEAEIDNVIKLIDSQIK